MVAHHRQHRQCPCPCPCWLASCGLTSLATAWGILGVPLCSRRCVRTRPFAPWTCRATTLAEYALHPPSMLLLSTKLSSHACGTCVCVPPFTVQGRHTADALCSSTGLFTTNRWLRALHLAGNALGNTTAARILTTLASVKHNTLTGGDHTDAAPKRHSHSGAERARHARPRNKAHRSESDPGTGDGAGSSDRSSSDRSGGGGGGGVTGFFKGIVDRFTGGSAAPASVVSVLRTLDLQGNNLAGNSVTDAVVAVVTHNRSLRELLLQGNRLPKDCGLQLVVATLRNRHLWYLRLGGNTAILAQHRLEIHKTLRRNRVRWAARHERRSAQLRRRNLAAAAAAASRRSGAAGGTALAAGIAAAASGANGSGAAGATPARNRAAQQAGAGIAMGRPGRTISDAGNPSLAAGDGSGNPSATPGGGVTPARREGSEGSGATSASTQQAMAAASTPSPGDASNKGATEPQAAPMLTCLFSAPLVIRWSDGSVRPMDVLNYEVSCSRLRCCCCCLLSSCPPSFTLTLSLARRSAKSCGSHSGPRHGTLTCSSSLQPRSA